jgi:hypothetical protein
MKHHYVYGSGQPGCLYDSGPDFSPTLSGALDSLSFRFDNLPKLALQRMRGDLRRHGVHYFPRGVRARNEAGELESIASLAGASFCEVSKADGPCPENDE